MWTARSRSQGEHSQLQRRSSLISVTVCFCDSSFPQVVALHPDQAAEPTLRLALALRKPCAIVPCCVYSAGDML